MSTNYPNFQKDKQILETFKDVFRNEDSERINEQSEKIPEDIIDNLKSNLVSMTQNLQNDLMDDIEKSLIKLLKSNIQQYEKQVQAIIDRAIDEAVKKGVSEKEASVAFKPLYRLHIKDRIWGGHNPTADYEIDEKIDDLLMKVGDVCKKVRENIQKQEINYRD